VLTGSTHPVTRNPPPPLLPQANTPRTLQEILPALMAEIIDALADQGGRALL
jgi:hypothetical protein